MSFYLFAIFSYSICIAALAGLFRIGKVSPAYYPFIWYTVIASVNEVYSYIVVTRYGLSNNANNNIYTLAEALIISWQLYNWGLFFKKRKSYLLLQLSFVLVWLYDLYGSGDIFSLLHRYRIYYALVLTLLCLNSLNDILFGSRRSVYRNTQFLMCIGMIVLYTFKIITELYWWYGSGSSDAFLYSIYAWFGYVNCIINLMFILAVLWIPKKPRYISFI